MESLAAWSGQQEARPSRGKLQAAHGRGISLTLFLCPADGRILALGCAGSLQPPQETASGSRGPSKQVELTRPKQHQQRHHQQQRRRRPAPQSAAPGRHPQVPGEALGSLDLRRPQACQPLPRVARQGKGGRIQAALPAADRHLGRHRRQHEVGVRERVPPRQPRERLPRGARAPGGSPVGLGARLPCRREHRGRSSSRGPPGAPRVAPGARMSLGRVGLHQGGGGRLRGAPGVGSEPGGPDGRLRGGGGRCHGAPERAEVAPGAGGAHRLRPLPDCGRCLSAARGARVAPRAPVRAQIQCQQQQGAPLRDDRRCSSVTMRVLQWLLQQGEGATSRGHRE